MQSTEQICTFLVTADTRPAAAPEIKAALESGDPDAVRAALQSAIGALLAGEPLPGLFITLVRYVLPSEDHAVQKLLLLYLVSQRERGGGRRVRGCDAEQSNVRWRARVFFRGALMFSLLTRPLSLSLFSLSLHTGNDQEDG